MDDQPARMVREHLLLNQLAGEGWFVTSGWAQADDGLELRFSLRVVDKDFDGVLVYPSAFPDVPCYIRPQRKGESWSHHQYGGSGVLCLERGPDNWDPAVTGVDMVRSANHLLGAERMRQLVAWPEPVASRHMETHGQSLRSHPDRLVLTEGFYEALQAAGGPQQTAAVRIEAAVWYLDRQMVLVPLALGEPATAVKDVPADVMRAELLPKPGWLVAGHLDPATPIATVDALLDALKEAWPWPDGLPSDTELLCVLEPDNTLCAYLVKGGDSPGVLNLKVVDYRGKSSPRQPARFADLGSKKVAILGLGSVGGKVAVSMCRAGVRRFILVDDDVLGPENLVRNELTWRDVAFDKVEAIRRQLGLIAAGVEVEVFRLRLAGQENPRLAADVAVALQQANLVVDATASAPAFLSAAAQCKRTGVAMVWGELFAGGGGGMLARSRPGLDADPLAVRNHVLGVLGTLLPVPKLVNAGRYSGSLDGETFVASDADVSALAAAMSQFSLDTLSGGETDYPYAAYLLGFRKFWEFRQPFETVPIDCTGAILPAGAPAPLTAQEDEVLDSLLQELKQAHAQDNAAT
ncbi:MAG: ThiF family adenylyltransferase [Pseudomonadota bacterium]